MKKTICFNTNIMGIVAMLLAMMFSVQSFSQTKTIKGKVVKASDGGPLANATITVKGTKQAISTNEQGEFVLSVNPGKQLVLIASYVGYYSKEEYAETGITIALEEKTDESNGVVVTGMFDKRKRMDASVAISSLGTQLIDRSVPASATDLLKNVPGVYVNSSNGEIRNTLASRGIVAAGSSQDGSFGYEYVSIQEDGLPVTNTTYYSYSPDFFLRPDATLLRVDAVRGGTASIAAANAPGGIFNYISKTGGSKFEGEIRSKYGLVGNGHNSYGRLDADFGGPMGKNWFYNIGGFYRYDQGPRYPGYPMNVGGGLKANLVKKYKQGSLKIFLKFLDDKNGYSQAMPTFGYTHPKLADGFTGNASVYPPALDFVTPDFLKSSGADSMRWNPKNQVKDKYKSLGFNWEHNLGKGWNFTNAARYSANSTLYNTVSGSFASSLTDITTYGLVGALGAGIYSFKNAKTGAEVANVTSTPNIAIIGGTPTIVGFNYTVNSNNLPNQNTFPNSIFLIPVNYYKNKVNEFIDQFMFNKKTKNMNFTLGGYYGYSNVHRYSGVDGTIFATEEDHPQLLSVSFTGQAAAGPGNYQVTNPQGAAMVAGNTGAFITFNAKQNQSALFFAHTWNIDKQWTFDWGARFERVNIKGDNVRGYLGIGAGADKNPFTLYDNNELDSAVRYDFSKTINTFSFSGALNYKFNDNMALYARYSQGKKAPDLDYYFTLNTPATIALSQPKVRSTQQIEAGLKAKTNWGNFFITPFYSILSGVPLSAMFQDQNGVFYNPPSTYGKFRTIGVEIEANADISKQFSVRAVATVQKSKIVDYSVWNHPTPSRTTDTLISYAGNETDNMPRIMLNITPTYTVKNFYTFLTWNYMGSRQANAANVFKMPGFSQFDYSAGYNFNKRFRLSFNVNNLFNTYGVMSWLRPGNIVDVLSGNATFTKDQYNTAVKNNTPYSTIAIQPRAYYLTATFKF